MRFSIEQFFGGVLVARKVSKNSPTNQFQWVINYKSKFQIYSTSNFKKNVFEISPSFITVSNNVLQDYRYLYTHINFSTLSEHIKLVKS